MDEKPRPFWCRPGRWSISASQMIQNQPLLIITIPETRDDGFKSLSSSDAEVSSFIIHQHRKVMSERPRLTLNTNVSGETLVASPHSSRTWSSGCSSSATLGPQSDELVLANSVLNGQIRNCQDFLDLDISWPIKPWVCDAALNHIFQQPNERWQVERGAILLLLQAAESDSGVNSLGDTALHTLAGIPGQASADFMSLLFCEVDEALPKGTSGRYNKIINDQNLFGNTALLVGVLYNQLHCVSFLLKKGADPDIPGELDKTAMEFALDRGYVNLVSLLEGALA